VLWIRDILVGYESRSGSLDPHHIDLRIRIRILHVSSVACKLPPKNKFFLSLIAYYFLKVHLHQSSKIKSQKVIKKTVEIKFSLTFFFLLMEVSGSGSQYGSGRPKNIRLGIHNTACNDLRYMVPARHLYLFCYHRENTMRRTKIPGLSKTSCNAFRFFLRYLHPVHTTQPIS
jgi:hypothetical protein